VIPNTLTLFTGNTGENYGAHFPLKIPSSWVECWGFTLGSGVQIGYEVHTEGNCDSHRE
jgi:hypothetical protein